MLVVFYMCVLDREYSSQSWFRCSNSTPLPVPFPSLPFLPCHLHILPSICLYRASLLSSSNNLWSTVACGLLFHAIKSQPAKPMTGIIHTPMTLKSALYTPAHTHTHTPLFMLHTLPSLYAYALSLSMAHLGHLIGHNTAHVAGKSLEYWNCQFWYSLNASFRCLRPAPPPPPSPHVHGSVLIQASLASNQIS